MRNDTNFSERKQNKHTTYLITLKTCLISDYHIAGICPKQTHYIIDNTKTYLISDYCTAGIYADLPQCDNKRKNKTMRLLLMSQSIPCLLEFLWGRYNCN